MPISQVVNVAISMKSAPTTVKVYIASDNDAETDDIEGIEKNSIINKAIGDSISVTAKEVAGKSFLRWENAFGMTVSSNPIYSFNVFSNTFLRAVYADYEPSSVPPGVTFFNANGKVLSTVNCEANTMFADLAKPTATLNGYTFIRWSIDDSTAINGRVMAVAIYDKDNTSSVAGVTVNGALQNGVKYGNEITVADNDDAFSYWTRDGKIVSYADSYKFYVWGATEIVSVHDKSITAEPSIVLAEDSINGYYMIEYDVPDGFEKVESGIIFGGNEDITVDHCYSKAVSQRADVHGQFSATRSSDASGTAESFVRGYLIFKSGSDYKIIYAD